MEKTIIYFNSFPFKSALIKIKTNLNFLFCEILACEMHCATISMWSYCWRDFISHIMFHPQNQKLKTHQCLHNWLWAWKGDSLFRSPLYSPCPSLYKSLMIMLFNDLNSTFVTVHRLCASLIYYSSFSRNLSTNTNVLWAMIMWKKQILARVSEINPQLQLMFFQVA